MNEISFLQVLLTNTQWLKLQISKQEGGRKSNRKYQLYTFIFVTIKYPGQCCKSLALKKALGYPGWDINPLYHNFLLIIYQKYVTAQTQPCL